MERPKIKNPPLFVELPPDLRLWLEETRKRDGFTIKEKTIRIFKQARHLDLARQVEEIGVSS